MGVTLVTKRFFIAKINLFLYLKHWKILDFTGFISHIVYIETSESEVLQMRKTKKNSKQKMAYKFLAKPIS